MLSVVSDFLVDAFCLVHVCLLGFFLTKEQAQTMLGKLLLFCMSSETVLIIPVVRN